MAEMTPQASKERGKSAPEAVRVLIVCMWPLGGIRTYLKYNYKYFPQDLFSITLLANPAIEREAIAADMAALGIRVEWAPPLWGKNLLCRHVYLLKRRERFDVIHSQGFISAFHTALVNWWGHVPHVMTTHGVLEEKRFAGRFGRWKRAVFQRALRDVDVFVGVGRDILAHVREGLPALRERARWEVIRNGIDPEPFVRDYPGAAERLREQLGIDGETFLFGYFGRFMPEKGFVHLIEAAERLAGAGAARRFAVLAVGSGDYEREYRAMTVQLGVHELFRFQPFQANVAELLQGCDAVVMPSVWEAYPLLTSEVLCSGTPLVATTCPGLREAVEGTPAVTVAPGDPAALAEAMRAVMEDPGMRERFRASRAEAARRFDVRESAERLAALLTEAGRSATTDGPRGRT